jgi:hypothetical protein
MIEDNEAFQSIRSSIKETLQSSFNKAKEFSSIFEPYIKTHLENLALGIN